MGVLDTLTILIEGDATGIEKVLKTSIQTVTGTVDKMNKEEVDWTSIFTRAISPAIIGGIASMFAFAVAQSMQFQEAMNTAGTAAGESSGQIAQTGQSALAMSAQTGQSAQNIADAMLQVSSIFGANTADTNAVTQAMTQLADSGFGNLSDIVASTIPLFQQFGITTGAQAVQMLTDLMHGAEASKESISTLASQFEAYTPALVAAGASMSSFNGLISDFSGRIQSLGIAGAQAAFKALADSANSPVGPMELLGQNIGKVQSSIVTGDVAGLVDNLAKKLNSMGNISTLVATQMGLSTDQVNLLRDSLAKLPTTNSDIKSVATNTQTVQQAWDQSDSALREFGIDWNKLVALVTSGTLGQFFTALAKGIGKDLDTITALINGSGLKDILGPTGLAVINKLAGIPAVTQPTPFTPSSSDAIQKILSGTGLGFSSNSLNNIDSQAVSSGIISSLVQALQSGGQGNSSNINNIRSTFNLTLPSTGNISANQIAKALYSAFQGTTP